MLSFTPLTTLNLSHVEIYKRPSAGADVFVERERIVDRVPGTYPYWYMLTNAEPDTTYVINYLDASNASVLTTGQRLATTVYEPPVPISQEIPVNVIMYVKELTRRQYLVLETMGEKCILLRRLREGLSCSCRTDESHHANARCLTCYGTGWEGGYTVFSPFLMNNQLAGERLQLTETAIAIDQTPRAWTTIVPELRDGDVVVRQHGQLLDRFEITNPARSVRDGVGAIPTIQEFSVKAHSQGHPVYNFPVENFVTSYVPPVSHSGLPEAGV